MDSVWIDGKSYQLDSYVSSRANTRKLNTLERDIISFISEWNSGKEKYDLHTSGSTGQPTVITIHRDQMVASAKMTLNYLNLKQHGSALLCLNPIYIAGIMMIVRSIIGKMNLYIIPPSANPLMRDDLTYDFDLAAFVPYQLSGILSNTLSMNNFIKIKNILIGGADISVDLLKKMRPFENRIYQTFGMTETVSHIALRRISGKAESEFYEVLEDIEIGNDDRGCLTIKGNITGNDLIVTNDLVDLIDRQRFVWKGRIDQVINTGGIIININDLETRIHKILNSNKINSNFFVAGMEDDILGEKIILVIEACGQVVDEGFIIGLLRRHLSRYEAPKKMYTIDKFSLLDTGKIDRKTNLQKLDF